MKQLAGWRLIILAAAVIAVAAGGFFLYSRVLTPDTTANNSTKLVAVRTGNISQTLMLSGPLTYFETNSLNFGAGGTIQDVTVAVGDTVKKGQVLAKLDAASSRALQTAVLNAQVALDTAQVNLNNANRPDSNPQINQAKVAITTAQIALNTSQTNLYNAQHPYTDLQISQSRVSVLTSQNSLNTSQTNLYNAQHPYTDLQISQSRVSVLTSQNSLNTSQTNLYNAQHPYTDLDIANAQAAVTNAQIAINTSQNNLYNTQHPYTDSQIAKAQTDLDLALKNLANVKEKNRIDFTVAWIAVDNANRIYQYFLYSANYGELSSYTYNASVNLSKAQNTLDIVVTNNAKSLAAAEDQVTQAQNTLTTMTTPPDPLIVQQKQNQLLIAQLNLGKVQDTLVKVLAGPDLQDVALKQEQVAVAQYNLQVARDNLAKMLAGPDPQDVALKQEQVAVAQYNLQVARDNLAKMLAGPDPWDVQLRQQQVLVAQNNLANAQQSLIDQQKALNSTLRQIAVDNAQAALDQAKIAAQSTNLTAPISGVVTAVSIRPGQTVNVNSPTIDIAVPSAFGLSALVSQLDIARINLEQAATVRIDAISNRLISGTVASINSTPITQSGVVSYRVTVLVPAPAGGQLRAGMTGFASVILQHAEDVLLVPNNAIGGSAANPTVMVLVDNQTQTLPVKTGIVGINETQIISGLEQGMFVVVNSTKAGTVKSGSANTTKPGTTANSTAKSTTIPTDQPIQGGGAAPAGGAQTTPVGGGQTAPAGGGQVTPVTPAGGGQAVPGGGGQVAPGGGGGVIAPRGN